MLFCHLHYADITLNSNTGPSIQLVCVVYGCALYLKHTVAFIIKQIAGKKCMVAFINNNNRTSMYEIFVGE